MLVRNVSATQAVAAVVMFNLTTMYVGIAAIALGVPLTAALLDLPHSAAVVAWIGLGVLVALALGLGLLVRRGAVVTLVDALANLRLISAERREQWSSQLAELDGRLKELGDAGKPGDPSWLRRRSGLASVQLVRHDHRDPRVWDRPDATARRRDALGRNPRDLVLEHHSVGPRHRRRHQLRVVRRARRVAGRRPDLHDGQSRAHRGARLDGPHDHGDRERHRALASVSELRQLDGALAIVRVDLENVGAVAAHDRIRSGLQVIAHDRAGVVGGDRIRRVVITPSRSTSTSY